MHSHAEVCKLLNVNPNTLATWVRLGYITPKNFGKKQRVANYFDEQNLREIQVLQNMIKSGIKRHLAYELMQYMDCYEELENGRLRFSFMYVTDIENI